MMRISGVVPQRAASLLKYRPSSFVPGSSVTKKVTTCVSGRRVRLGSVEPIAARRSNSSMVRTPAETGSSPLPPRSNGRTVSPPMPM